MELSFLDMSYSNDSSDCSIPDIFDMKHLHRKKSISSSGASAESPKILGTVIKVESCDEGPSLSEEALSIDCSAPACSGRRNRKKTFQKQSEYYASFDVTSSLHESDALSLNGFHSPHVPVADSSHKRKRKKTSEKLSESDASFDVTGSLHESDTLNRFHSPQDPVSGSTQKRKRKKTSEKLSESDASFDVTGSLHESDTLNGFHSPRDPTSDSSQKPKTKRKKKSRKLAMSDAVSDVMSSVQKPDGCDNNASCQRKKNSRKLSQSDTVISMTRLVEESESIACDDNRDVPVSVKPHKHKRKKHSEESPDSATLRDVTSSVLDAGSVNCDDSPSQNVPTSVSPRKHKKKSHKLAEPAILCDGTNSVQEPDASDRNVSHRDSVSVCSSKRKKKSTKLPESDSACDVTCLVAEPDSCDNSQAHHVPVSVNSHKHKRKHERHKLAESDHLSEVPRSVLDVGSLDCSDSQSKNVSTSVTCQTLKKKKRHHGLAESDTLCDVTRSVPEVNGLDCCVSPSQSVPVKSHKHKKRKKHHKLAESETLCDVTNLVQEARSVNNYDSTSQNEAAPVKSEKRKKKKKSRQFAESDSLCDVPSSVLDADSLDCCDSPSQSVPVTVESQKRKKKHRKLAESDNLSDVTSAVLEPGSLDCNDLQAQHVAASVKSHKHKRRKHSHKLAESDVDSVLEANNDSLSRDEPASASSRKRKKKKKSNKLAESETLSDVIGSASEPGNVDGNDSRTCRRKKKKNRKFSECDVSPDVALLMWEGDISDVNDSLQVLASDSSFDKSTIRAQPGPSLIVKETDSVNGDDTRPTQISDSRDTSKRKKKPRTRCVTSYDTDDAENITPPVASAPRLKRRKKSSQLETLPEMTDHIAEDNSGNGSSSETLQSTSIGSRRKKLAQLETLPESTDQIAEDNKGNGSRSETPQSTSVGSSSEETRTQTANELPDAALDETTEPCENVESNDGNDSSAGFSNLQVEEKHLCPAYRHASRRSSSVELSEEAMVKELRAVEDDDDEFANVLHWYEGNVSYPRFRKIEKVLRDAGLSTHGKSWSVNETAQLRNNWEAFCEGYPDAQADKMLGRCECDDDDEKQYIRHLIKDEDFYVRLGVNIRRHLCQIYNRARSLLVPRTSDKITQADHATLANLHKTVGNKWSVIAREMGTTEYRARKACNPPTKLLKKGQWSREEDALLKDALRAAVGNNLLALDPALFTWPEIAKNIPGRDDTQCYSHWYGIIESRLRMEAENISPVVHRASGRLKSNITNSQVVDSIDSLGINCSSQIDWKRLQQLMDDNVPVSIYRSRWNGLRRRTPDYKKKTFTEIMEHLKRKWCVE